MARQPADPLEQTPPTAPANDASPAPRAVPSAAELYEMIAEAAYYRAQKRGFVPGLEAQDWSEAEAEVMERVKGARR